MPDDNMTFEDAGPLVGKRIRFRIENPEEIAWGVGELDYANGKLFIRAYNENLNDRSGGGQAHFIPLTAEQEKLLLTQKDSETCEI